MVKSNNTQLSRFARFALGRLFPLPFIAIGTFLTYFQTTAFYRAHQSKSWPKTTGVVHINIGEYRRKITYQYSVNGANYSSDRVIFGEDNGGRNPSKEWNIVSEFPSGKRVDVYYMPQNPEVSTLFTEVREGSWFQLSQGMVFLFAGVIIFTSLPKLLKRTAEQEGEAHRPA